MLNSNRAGAILTIDLGAICENWQILNTRLGTAHCAAVVKADAYGLGANPVGTALSNAGCQHFFVGYLSEALSLKPHLQENATIYVLHGCPPGDETELVKHNLIPVLNSLPEIKIWTDFSRREGKRHPAVIQVDTGMARMGLSDSEITTIKTDPHLLNGIDVHYIMSHLGCAEISGSPLNAQQLMRFNSIRNLLPPAPASLANSSGIFLGKDYHFDLARSGAALYGITPVVGEANPMKPVIRLQAKVLQIRNIEAGAGVGYGPSWRAPSPRRIATVLVGYADGYFRSLSNTALGYFGNTAVRLIGTISMDSAIFDISDIPENAIHPGSFIDLINEQHPVDILAEEAGTIGYEILTRLGARYYRHYIEPHKAAMP